MLIAQITDVHLGFGKEQGELNRARLDRVIDTLRKMAPRPDLLLVTGDIVDKDGDAGCYAQFRDAVADLPFPFFPLLGNHDRRSAFLEHFAQAVPSKGGVQYAIEDFPARILMLDTVEEGRHGGAFCEDRAIWLDERLSEQPDRPTIIALHHPPLATGLSWMKEDPEAQWVRRLHAIVSSHAHIAGLVAGHLHRPITASWAGTILSICPSTAPLLALDLEALDPEVPDGRAMIVADPPCYALHLWDGGSLVSHFESAQDHEVIARFSPEMQPFLKMLRKEREG